MRGNRLGGNTSCTRPAVSASVETGSLRPDDQTAPGRAIQQCNGPRRTAHDCWFGTIAAASSTSRRVPHNRETGLTSRMPATRRLVVTTTASLA
jgi:hypothetical protein